MNTPLKSELRQSFWDQRLDFVSKMEEAKEQWYPLIQRFEYHMEDVTSICFSTDGKLLASVARDGGLAVWELARGCLWSSLKVELIAIHIR